MPNVIKIEETFCGRTDVHTDGPCQIQSLVTQKLGQILKNPARTNLDIVPSL